MFEHLEGDILLIQNGHFRMAISLELGGSITVFTNRKQYLQMTGLTFSEFTKLELIAHDRDYCFYWFPA